MDRAPLRIVSLCAAATETVAALGMGDRLVGVDNHSAAREAAAAPVIGRGGTLSAERLAAAAPEVAFAWWYQHGAIEQMERLGILVVRLRAENAEEAIRLVERVAEACGAAEKGQRLAQQLRRELKEAEETVPARAPAERPLVYVELHAPFKSCGPGSYTHDLVVRAGGRSLAGDAAVRYPTLSNETILASQPEVILLVRARGAREANSAGRPGWSALRAVQLGRVHVVENDLVSPGPRVADAVRTLIRLLYPGQEK